jgi:hypothetical protein
VLLDVSRFSSRSKIDVTPTPHDVSRFRENDRRGSPTPPKRPTVRSRRIALRDLEVAPRHALSESFGPHRITIVHTTFEHKLELLNRLIESAVCEPKVASSWPDLGVRALAANLHIGPALCVAGSSHPTKLDLRDAH